MSELILKFNQLDDFGKTALIEFLNSLLNKTNRHQDSKTAQKPPLKLDYARFQIPIAQLKFDRDEMNVRD